MGGLAPQGTEEGERHVLFAHHHHHPIRPRHAHVAALAPARAERTGLSRMAGERDCPATGPADCRPIAIRARYRGIDGPDCPGGDFYARCEAADRTRVVLGDVRGKGAPAAGKARLLTDTFLAAAATCAGLEDVSRALDRVACADAAAEADPAAAEWFATAVLLEIDADGRNITMINHGHPSPLLVGPDTVRELPPTRARLPLGLGGLAPAPDDEDAPGDQCGNTEKDGFGETDGPGTPPADTVELPPDSTLILFTDGLSEARDRTGRMFDPVAWLAGTPDLGGPARLLDRLYLEAERHNGGSWRDDLALLSVRRRTPGAEAPTRQPLPSQSPKPASVPRPSPRTSVSRTTAPLSVVSRTTMPPTPEPPTTEPRTPAPRPPLPDSGEHPPIPSPLTASKLPARPRAPIPLPPAPAPLVPTPSPPAELVPASAASAPPVPTPATPTPLVSAPIPARPASASARHRSDPSSPARSRPRPSTARAAPPVRPAPPTRPARPT